MVEGKEGSGEDNKRNLLLVVRRGKEIEERV